jgi:hypothetical protein
MKNCPTCQNDLVCHDQGECLRPTPETERLRWQLIDKFGTGTFEEVLPKLAAMEIQRNKAREQLSSEKSTRNAIIAKGIEMEHQLSEARQKLEIAMAANSDVERIAKERNEAQKAFVIATDQLVQVQGELRQAREENARLREALSVVLGAGWDGPLPSYIREQAAQLLTP